MKKKSLSMLLTFSVGLWLAIPGWTGLGAGDASGRDSVGNRDQPG